MDTRRVATLIPCGHLIEPGPDGGAGRCEIERRFPEECCACAAYLPGLTAQERTRCEIWTRVMGYHRPLTAFNPGKQSEHAERKYFRESPLGVVAPVGDGQQVVLQEPGELPQPSHHHPRLQWL